MPSVTVVMPVYNGEQYLAEAIESILNQTFTDFEFLIVDDGSQDSSAAIIRDYANRDERIRVIQHERNQGQASARNSGIAAAAGRFIAAMDSDDISLPQRLEKQVNFLQSHPDIGVVGTFLHTVSADKTGRQSHAYPQQHAIIVLESALGNTAVAGAATMARRNILRSVSGYESSQNLAIDKELFTRLFGTTRFANLPMALYVYRLHHGQMSQMSDEEQKTVALEIRRRWLARLWGEAPPACIDRLDRLRKGTKLGWRERRLLRQDLERLLDAMVSSKALVESDLPLLEAELNRRLESAMPRRWQMFLHWRRHHFGSGKHEKAV